MSDVFCCPDAAGIQKQLQTAQEQVSQVKQRADADSERLQQAQSKADAALKQAKQDLDQVQHYAAPLHAGSLCKLTTAKQVMPSVQFAASLPMILKTRLKKLGRNQQHQRKVLAQPVHCIVHHTCPFISSLCLVAVLVSCHASAWRLCMCAHLQWMS